MKDPAPNNPMLQELIDYHSASPWLWPFKVYRAVVIALCKLLTGAVHFLYTVLMLPVPPSIIREEAFKKEVRIAQKYVHHMGGIYEEERNRWMREMAESRGQTDADQREQSQH